MDETAARQPKLPPSLQMSLLLFLVVGGAVAALVPQVANLVGRTSQPNLLQLLLTGAALIILTGWLLRHTAKVVGLSQAWWAWALLYNSLIIITKFIMAPASLYDETFETGFSIFDPNSPAVYAAVAGGVAALYGLVAFLIYRVYRQKVKAALPGDPTPPEPPAVHRKRLVVATALTVLVLLAGYASGLLMGRPLILSIGTLQYLQYAFSGIGLLIILSSVATVFAAIRAFSSAADIAIAARDNSVLPTFFWFGLCLLLVYHALWAVYMTALLSLWSF